MHVRVCVPVDIRAHTHTCNSSISVHFEMQAHSIIVGTNMLFIQSNP